MSLTVVKLGSTLVADDRGDVRREVLQEVCRQVGELDRTGDSATLVTSGAIALGMRRMGMAVRPRRSRSCRPRRRSGRVRSTTCTRSCWPSTT